MNALKGAFRPSILWLPTSLTEMTIYSQGTNTLF